MLDFLHFFNAFDPDDDIGKSMPEACDAVRTFNEDLSFTTAGIFRPQELNVSERPVVDLPTTWQDVTITRRNADGTKTSRTERRLLKQSEVGKPVGLPGPGYFSMKTAVERAFERTKLEAFKSYTPEPCPWQGALIAFWHTAQRVLNYNVKDAVLKAANTELIIETGEALRGLSRGVGDSSSGIVREKIRKLTNSADPKAELLAIKADAQYWIDNAGSDKELAAKEAQSCTEELLEEAGITMDEFQRSGAMRNPSTGKLIHMRNVVDEMRIQGANGELIRLGVDEDGNNGVILSADEISDIEVEKAEEHVAAQAAENLAANAGRNSTPIPILLESDIHRPERWCESEEMVRTFQFTVVDCVTKNTQVFVVEGEQKALEAKDKWDAKFPAFMATGIVQVGQYRRTFGGYWSLQDNGSYMRAVGRGPSMQPKDMDCVNHLGIVIDAYPGSGWTEEDLGCYAEQAGEVTLILAPDWVTMNVDFDYYMRGEVERINNLTAADVASYSDRQVQHRLISALVMGPDKAPASPSCQRFLRGKLRERIGVLNHEAGWTPRMAAAIKPMFSVGFDTFHMVRGKVGKELSALTNAERTVAWTFINVLREELRADALKQVVPEGTCDQLIEEIRRADTAQLSVLRERTMTTALRSSGWKAFLLNDELMLRRTQLRKQQ